MKLKRERPALRLLFDELLPYRVALALNELGFRTSHVGHQNHGQPARGSDDKDVLDHAMATNQIFVTSNHDMIILCAERRQSVIWIDPRGRQFTHDELAVVAFTGIAEWYKRLTGEASPVCIRVLRTKLEVITLERASALATTRLRSLRSRSKRKARRVGVIDKSAELFDSEHI